MCNWTRWLVAALLLGIATPVHSGGLSFVEIERDGVGGVDGIHATTGVALSPDGAHVYVSGRSDNAVAVFSRDGGTGALTFVEFKQDGIGGVDGLGLVSGVTVSPDGAHVYVTAELDSAVAAFSRNAGTGALTFVEVQKDGIGGVDGLHTATSVACSSDGAHVYVTGQDDDAVAVFSRNIGTGALTFVEVKKDGVGGVGGLRRPRAVVVSPDGAHVYVAGEGSDAVAVFSRNAGTGALTFVEFQQDGTGGINGLRRPHGIAVSPDGATLYVAGQDDNALAAFARNAGTGALTFIEVVKGSEAKGLKGASAVVVSPDGRYVYATGSIDNDVVVLRRNTMTGVLTFLETQGGGHGASAIAVSADGSSVYAAAREENAVTAFDVDACGDGHLGTDEQCDDGGVLPGDGCSASCRLELCGAAPAGGCRQSQTAKSTLDLRESAANRLDKLKWKFSRGDATTLAEFGDPTSTASYVICLYDASGAPQPLLSLAAPAGGTCNGLACWNLSGSGYRYKDKFLTPDGLSTALLRAGLEDGKTQLQFQGKGGNLFLPAGLPLVVPLVVQVSNSETGVCWQTTFSVVPIITTANKVKLKAKND